MATPELPVGYLEGGRTYLVALEGLGLRPSALFWAYDQVIHHFVLVLASEEYDLAGPLELTKILFKAYNAEATPPAIDPFIVRLHSPRQPIMEELGKFLPFRADFTPTITTADGKAVPGVTRAEFVSMQVNAGGLNLSSAWVYRFEKDTRRSNSADARRRWRRFERNVDRAAA